jgi:hypothetical protein
MPIFIKLQFVCETGTQCRSPGRDFNSEDVSIPIVPSVEGIVSALKTVPSGWKRDALGRLVCQLCARGPVDLGTVGGF